MFRFSMKTVLAITLCLLSCITSLQPLLAQGPKLLKPEAIPADKRIAPLKDLDGYFPFHNADSVQAWQRRQVQIRQRLLVSQVIWPMPTKTPLNALIH